MTQTIQMIISVALIAALASEVGINSMENTGDDRHRPTHGHEPEIEYVLTIEPTCRMNVSFVTCRANGSEMLGVGGGRGILN